MLFSKVKPVGGRDGNDGFFSHSSSSSSSSLMLVAPVMAVIMMIVAGLVVWELGLLDVLVWDVET